MKQHLLVRLHHLQVGPLFFGHFSKPVGGIPKPKEQKSLRDSCEALGHQTSERSHARKTPRCFFTTKTCGVCLGHYSSQSFKQRQASRKTATAIYVASFEHMPTDLVSSQGPSHHRTRSAHVVPGWVSLRGVDQGLNSRGSYQPRLSQQHLQRKNRVETFENSFVAPPYNISQPRVGTKEWFSLQMEATCSLTAPTVACGWVRMSGDSDRLSEENSPHL